MDDLLPMHVSFVTVAVTNIMTTITSYKGDARRRLFVSNLDCSSEKGFIRSLKERRDGFPTKKFSPAKCDVYTLFPG